MLEIFRRFYDLTDYFNATYKFSLSDTETTETIQTTNESTILNEKSQTINILVPAENVISTTSLYETQDSTEQTEKITENDYTVQIEQLAENDSNVGTEKIAERIDTSEEVKHCTDNKKEKTIKVFAFVTMKRDIII